MVIPSALAAWCAPASAFTQYSSRSVMTKCAILPASSATAIAGKPRLAAVADATAL